MWWLLAPGALAVSPSDRLSFVAEAGVYTAQSGVAFGLEGGLRSQGFTFGAKGLAGGRIPTIDVPISQRAGFGLGALQLGLDAPVGTEREGAGGPRLGVAAVLDVALLDAVEEDCSRQFGCRSQFFWRPTRDAGSGLSFQPAGGLRVEGGGPGPLRYVLIAGAQPTSTYARVPDLRYTILTPRLDFALWHVAQPWSLHAWAGRYGLAVGIGHTLSGPSGPRDPG